MRITKYFAYSLLLVFVALLVLWTKDNSGAWGAQKPSSGGEEKLKWKPNASDAVPAEYVGAPACAECHGAIFEKQKTTDMALAAARPADSRILRQHPVLGVEQGPYTYSITNQGGRVFFAVHDVQGKIEEPVILNIGAGTIHESYVFEHKGKYYQAPVSYYSALGKLVAADSAAPPASLEDALGTPLTPERVGQCMQCHGTSVGFGERVDVEHLVPGVHCEACHGPGALHVAAMRAGKLQETLIIAPARLNSDQEVEFCGTCHHGVQEVKRGDLRGIRTVLSQPYRLIHSRCWNSADRRSRCTFCHDAHQPLAHESAAYDPKCLACHASEAHAGPGANQPGKACPVGKRDCASCHMPRVEVPGGSSTYTDHRIRVVRPGEPYPE
jgi:hypothetical protein